VPTGENRTGYWTFVPFMVQSCGTLTSSGTSPVEPIDGCEGVGCSGGSYSGVGPNCDTTSDIKTTHDYCNISPLPDGPNGQTLGTVLYVAAPDVGGKPYADGQDPLYYEPGVSADPGWVGDASTARSAPEPAGN
jgi:hypothetical protein